MTPEKPASVLEAPQQIDMTVSEHEMSFGHSLDGEAPDGHAINVLSLAHRAVHKFPELVKRNKVFLRGSTISVLATGVIVLASTVIYRELSKGKKPEEILRDITPDDIESCGKNKFSFKRSGDKVDKRHLH